MFFLKQSEKYSPPASINLDSIYLIQDKILIKLSSAKKETGNGIIIPETVSTDSIKEGYIIKAGPGYLLGSEPDEMIQKSSYIPLRYKIGDRILFDSEHAIKINIAGEELYVISEAEIIVGEFMEF